MFDDVVEVIPSEVFFSSTRGYESVQSSMVQSVNVIEESEPVTKI